MCFVEGPRTPHTHACPTCGRPATHMDRYPRSVCEDCVVLATCVHERQVGGRNVSLSGGFEAYHDDQPDNLCAETTTGHRVWIRGRACTMGEARFGGVVVEAAAQTG